MKQYGRRKRRIRLLLGIGVFTGGLMLLASATPARAGDIRVDVNFTMGHRPPAVVRVAPVRQVVVRPVTRRVWVPGHYRDRYEKVVVREGYYERRWIPPVIEEGFDHRGRRFRRVIRPGRYEQVWIPAQHEVRTVRVWVAGHYVHVAR